MTERRKEELIKRVIEKAEAIRPEKLIDNEKVKEKAEEERQIINGFRKKYFDEGSDG